jgi:hypothetical protein
VAFADSGHPPQHGTLQLFLDGSFNYTPYPGFTGTDSFAFYASDGYLDGVDPTHQPATPSYVTILVLPPGPGNAARVPVLRDENFRVEAIRPANPEDAPLFLGRSAYNAGLISGHGVDFMQVLFRPVVVRPQKLTPAGVINS